MANRRGIDDFSSSSVDDEEKTTTSSSNLPRDNNPRVRDEPDHPAGSDSTRENRREENPFSFKHFLKKDPRPNYNMSGARPKVYSPARISPDEDNAMTDSEGIYPCNPTELPDFVQDHLVIEQCYLNNTAVAAASLPHVADIDNLPDFTINNAERRQPLRAQNREERDSDVTCDLPFDFIGRNERRNRERNPVSTNSIVENLPSYMRPNKLPIRQNETMRGVSGFPFDLPPTSGESRITEPIVNNSPSNEASVNKSLPDFLNDGPIRNRVGISPGEPDPTSDMPERSDPSLLLENERLREELNIARRHIADRTRVIETLKAELASRRAVDHDETAHLEKAMEQVENNLKRSTRRATIAESAVGLLKQEVKALTAEVSILRSENRDLRSIAGAGCADYRLPSTERKIKKLSDELRAAATSAEGSLRQLMAGVSNLKVLASALENVDRIEDRTKDFLPDFEEENAAGPAL